MANLFADVDKYINHLFVKDDEDLEAALKRADAAGIPRMEISAGQGKLLQVLAHMCRAERILELGTLVGYSTIWLAKALPPRGKLISLEMNPEHAAIARENIAAAGLNDKVEILTGKALDLLPELYKQGAGPFDMIFMDADKPPYTEYLLWALKLSRPGTIIVADNVVREGKVLDEASADPAVQGVQRFNKMLASLEGVTATLVQTVGIKDHDGMAIAVVNHS